LIAAILNFSGGLSTQQVVVVVAELVLVVQMLNASPYHDAPAKSMKNR